MKHWKWLATVAFGASVFLAPFQTASADEQGWGLVMRGPEPGVMYLYVSNEGFALVLKETGATFVSHAPDWRMVMYNDTTHVYYTESLSNFSLSPEGERAAQNTTQNSKVGTTGSVAGLPCTQYLITTYSSEIGKKDSEVWATTEIAAPEQLRRTFRKVFNMSPGSAQGYKGLPLKVTSTSRKGNRVLVYETVSAQRQMIRTASFTYPASYRRVDNEMAVLIDEDRQKKINSVLDDSGDLADILNSSSSTPSRPTGTTRPTATPTHYRQTTPPSGYRPPNKLGSAQPAATTKKSSGDSFDDLLNSLGK